MKKGDKVHWNWGRGEGEGTIESKTDKTIEKKIKGTTVKRKASKEEPAYEIKTDKGSKVIKSESELTKGTKDSKKDSSKK